MNRLTLKNPRRVLVSCFNDTRFTEVFALLRLTQFARDPETLLARALDASAKADRVMALGLYILAHLSEKETDVIAVLCRTANFPRGVPTWRYERAATTLARWRVSDDLGWKAPRMGEAQRRLRAQRAAQMREVWGKLEARIRALHEVGLERLGE